MPFEYKNKGAFGAKVGLYLATGFSIPFFATIYQLYVCLLYSRGPVLTSASSLFTGRSPVEHSLHLVGSTTIRTSRVLEIECFRALSFHIDRVRSIKSHDIS